VALDLFHVDKEVPTIKCDRCKITHPKVEYPKAQEELKEVSVMEVIDTHSNVLDLSATQCFCGVLDSSY